MRAIPGPRLASEGARGAADFETHLEEAGGEIFVVAIEWGRHERVIAAGCSSVTEAIREGRRDEWWRAGGPVEVRCRYRYLDRWSTLRLDCDGSWSALDHGRAA